MLSPTLVPYKLKLSFISIGSFKCNLTSLFVVIAQMWIELSLGYYRWYQSNLVTLCDTKSLHDIGPDKDAMDLIGGDCDTLDVLSI